MNEIYEICNWIFFIQSISCFFDKLKKNNKEKLEKIPFKFYTIGYYTILYLFI